jgi:hypothetical protein
MNKLNSKTTRIVSALALSAGLFSVSNSAMAVSCQAENNRYYGQMSCVTPYTAATTGNHKVTATAKATDKITGLGVKGDFFVVNSDNVILKKKDDFVGSTTITFYSNKVGMKYYAMLGKGADDGRVTKLKGTLTTNHTP